ncbi:hypothetical protein Y013_23490 [Rhodococcus pyridinivorans SB3094]|uniref:AB hydrolase-1 domain-containing protein n=1 Tax=Rhodococcus pyridinivorans SB3094 TaxID=1435356 RepID=V9XRD2_9NOCA|nr:MULTISPECIES: hypothetical protein [Rhodococcus]AHD23957.1 hypothetical protein Y013_23490 [Rhodococcus pyridinivorans SB3094]MCT7291950.1 hypothetical protein [Rhodococcus sp. PAE-6]
MIHDLDSRFGTTRVTECGPPGAPPVLLLPGAGATSMVWFANAAALGEAHRLLAVDIIGDVGRSVADGDPVRNVDDLLGWHPHRRYPSPPADVPERRGRRRAAGCTGWRCIRRAGL